MMPALDWLEINAVKLGAPTATVFFSGSGLLSSVLDNAPTYLTFLSALLGAFVDQELVGQVRHSYRTMVLIWLPFPTHRRNRSGRRLAALQKYHAAEFRCGEGERRQYRGGLPAPATSRTTSLFWRSARARCFFGANTYIGNGPNFMVKAIADQHKVHTPSFLAYIGKYTLPFIGAHVGGSVVDFFPRLSHAMDRARPTRAKSGMTNAKTFA